MIKVQEYRGTYPQLGKNSVSGWDFSFAAAQRTGRRDFGESI